LKTKGLTTALTESWENRVFGPAPTGPRSDGLGVVSFAIHALIGLYLLFGWLVPYGMELAFYMVLLPAVAGNGWSTAVPAPQQY